MNVADNTRFLVRPCPIIFSNNGYGLSTLIKLLSGVTLILKAKVKYSHYRPGVAQRVGRGIALLFHDRGTRRG